VSRAIAGIMWMSILKNKEYSISFHEFVKYGLLVNLVPLLIALGTLCFMA